MATRYWVGGTGNWTDTARWSTSSGGSGGASVPGSGDDVVFDANSGAGTTTVNSAITIASLSISGSTLPHVMAANLTVLGVITGSGAVRGIDLRGFKLTAENIAASSSWNVQSTLAGAILELTGSGTIGLPLVVSPENFDYLDLSYSGSASRTLGVGNSALNVKVSAGTGTFTFSSTAIRNLDLTGFAGTVGLGNLTLYGSFTSPSGVAWTGGTNSIAFNGSASHTISAGGKLNRPVSFSGSGTYQLQSNLVVSQDGDTARAIVHSAGGLDLNGYTIECGTFSSSNSNVRSITMGAGAIKAHSISTVINLSTTTNLTFSGAAGLLEANGSGSNARIISLGGLVVGDVKVSAGTGVVTLNGIDCANLDFTGFGGSISAANGDASVRGNLTFSSGMSVADGNGAFILTAQSTGKTITTNGITVNRPFTFDGDGGGWTLADNLNIGARKITLTRGSFNANGFNVSAGSFESSNTNTRTLTMGSGAWSLSGTATVWDLTTITGLTFNAGTAAITLTNNSATAKVFSGGGRTYPSFTWAGNGSGALSIFGANSFGAFTISPRSDNGTRTAQFESGVTQTFTGSVTLTGNASNPIAIRSTEDGVQHTLSKASGTVTGAYLDVKDSNATGGATWAPGTGSVSSGNNTGWEFAYNLVATEISAGAPTLGNPTLAQIHALTANAPTIGPPVLGPVSFSYIQPLTASALSAGAPVLDTPALTVSVPFDAIPMGAPIGGFAPLASLPLGGDAISGIGYILSADDLSAGAPSLGSPTLSITHQLTAAALSGSAPALATPALAQVHKLTAGNLTAAMHTLGSPGFTLIRLLQADSLILDEPTLDVPDINIVTIATADGITVTPVLPSPALNQVHKLVAFPISFVTPNLNYAFLNTLAGWATTGTNTLVADEDGAIFTQTQSDPQLYSPNISISGSAYPIIRIEATRTQARSIGGWDGSLYYTTAGHSYSGSYRKTIPAAFETVGERVVIELDMRVLNTGGTDWVDSTITRIRFDFDSAASGQIKIHSVTLGPISQPTIGTGALSQVHKFTAVPITTTPVLGSPAMAQAHVLGASNLTASPHTLGTPSAFIVSLVAANALSSGAPSLAAPALSQVHKLTASGLQTTPTLPSPAMTVIRNLIANAMVIGSPVLGSPAAKLIRLLSATGLSVGSYSLSSPPLSQAHSLAATPLSFGAYGLGAPPLSQAQVLQASDLSFGPHVFSSIGLSLDIDLIFAKYGGAWLVPTAHGKLGGTWRLVTDGWRKSGGDWIPIYRKDA
jgi:hypothetical protein